jgi:hypothetical protein
MRRRNPPAYREHMNVSVPTSEAFRRWFGNSKVKDETGRPVVVYHGTLNGGFTVFDPAKMGDSQAGFYFTPRFDGAAAYAEPPIFSFAPVEAAPYPTDANGDARIPDPVQGNKRGVYRVYLKIENPFIYEGRGRQWDALFVPEFPEARRTYEVAALARAAGHDGVIFKEIVDPGGEFYEPMDVYVVFDSRNIKSATANDGGYRPDDPDIRRNPMVAGFSRMRAYDPDTRIGNDEFQYLVEREIPALARHHWGGGSYAQVWRIPNANLVFKATRDESEIAAQARLISRGFSHPSIVDAYCVAESAHHKDVWFIVTRFVDFNPLPSDYWVWLRDNWEYLQDAAENADADTYPYDGNARGRAQQSRFQRWTDHLFDALRLLALEGIKWLDVSRDNLVLDPTTDLPVILDLGHSEVAGAHENVPFMSAEEAYRCALRVAGRKANPYRSRGVRSTRTLRR